jgi:hypothetical protein
MGTEKPCLRKRDGEKWTCINQVTDCFFYQADGGCFADGDETSPCGERPTEVLPLPKEDRTLDRIERREDVGRLWACPHCGRLQQDSRPKDAYVYRNDEGTSNFKPGARFTSFECHDCEASFFVADGDRLEACPHCAGPLCKRGRGMVCEMPKKED